LLISRHIRYADCDTIGHRSDRIIDPPIEFKSTLGNPDDEFFPESFEIIHPDRIPPIVNQGGILEIQELMKPGEMLSIEPEPGYRLDQIVIDPVHSLVILANDDSLVYRIIVGKQGMLSFSAKKVEDKERFREKIKVDVGDTAMRKYITKRSMADSNITMEAIEKIPEVMDVKRAAKYLDVSVSWLEKKGGSGEIPRTRHKKYRKTDLDIWMNSSPRKGRR